MAIADMVLLNGKVATVDKAFSFQEAIAVNKGWIIDVGTNEEIKRFIGSDTRVIDLKGNVILPGAHDGHSHGVYTGASQPPLFIRCRYPEVQSIKDINHLIEQEVKTKPAGTWIKGIGFETGFLEECKNDNTRLPRKWDFDAVTPDNPLVLLDATLHVMVVNSKALEVCGISKDTPNPSEGVMERDPQTGEPTGVFLEFPAQAMVNPFIPKLTNDEIKLAIKKAQAEFNKNGFTSYNDSSLGVGGDDLLGGVMGSRCIDVYKEMLDHDELTCRVSIGLLLGQYGSLSYDDVVNGLEKTQLPQGMDENWLNIPMLKVFADGIPLVYTSYMWDNYPGKDHHGRLCVPGNTDEEQCAELKRIIKYAHKKGFQLGIHATGDRAIDVCLEGFVEAMEEYPGKPPRHYVIHGDLSSEEWAKKASKYDVGISIQTPMGQLVYDAQEPVLGERTQTIFDMKKHFKAGVNCANGSDTPCIYSSWLDGAKAAVTRKSATSGRVFGPECRLTLEEAIRSYTNNGAYQERFEHVRGSIEVGKVADFQVLGEDIFKLDPEKYTAIPIVMTIVGGKIVYSAE